MVISKVEIGARQGPLAKKSKFINMQSLQPVLDAVSQKQRTRLIIMFEVIGRLTARFSTLISTTFPFGRTTNGIGCGRNSLVSSAPTWIPYKVRGNLCHPLFLSLTRGRSSRQIQRRPPAFHHPWQRRDSETVQPTLLESPAGG